MYCQLLLQNILDLMSIACPEMNNLIGDQKYLKTYMSFLFEANQDDSSICHSLSSTKLKFYSCWNHLAKPVTDSEKLYPSLNHPDGIHCIKKGVIKKYSVSYLLNLKPHLP